MTEAINNDINTKTADPKNADKQQSTHTRKPKWLMVLLFIGSVLYLFPEVAFNAKLVEIAGGIDVSDEQLHKTELFGRTISGIGVTLLVADLLLKGWFTATKLRAITSLIIITVLVWPTVFFGQKALIDAWLIEPSSAQQRQEAFFSSVLRSSLAMNAINIEGIPYNPDAHAESSEMTFLALIGGLVYSNDSFLHHIEDKKAEILERYIKNRANMNFNEHYDKYKTLRIEVQQAWKEYQTHVSKYNQSLESRHPRANKAWEEVETTIVKGYGDYQQAQKAYLARAEVRAQKIAQPIYDLFDDQQRCFERKGNSRSNCLNRIDERYERLLEKNAIPFEPIDYWLDIQHRRTKGETSWGEALGTLGLSALLAGLEHAAGQAGEAQQDRIYTNRVAHYTPRVLALWQNKFKNETGYPMGIDSISDFRLHSTTENKIRRDVSRKGIDLKSDWNVTKISEFKLAVKNRVVQETKSTWNTEAKKRSFNIPPNLSWHKFQQLDGVQVNIRNSMGERYYIEPMMATWNNKQFYQQVIIPNIKRERDYWLSYIEAARAQFADGGPYAEQGKTALRSIIVPPISMGLSLFLVILTVFKIPGKFIELLNYHKQRPARSVKSTVANIGFSLFVLLVIFIVPVNAFSSKYTQNDTTIGYFLDQISDTFSPSSAYAVRWVIHTQPLIHPIGAQIDRSMRITDGFSLSLERAVDQLDQTFARYFNVHVLGENQKDSVLVEHAKAIQKNGELAELPMHIRSNAQDLPGYRVRIMNIKPRYKHGIVLPIGNYDVEVSANGYQSNRLWVEHSRRQSTHNIELSKLSD
ncbi:hypothetical protein [uncultured Vibrio sp.]|uniref:hypothetical protein n=1 Tax=uncultured Vibrio sp. TaxID=114054 RepID=UPI0025DAF6A8|nr:hypothetical protein [uncultured Vibrio sp.]